MDGVTDRIIVGQKLTIILTPLLVVGKREFIIIGACQRKYTEMCLLVSVLADHRRLQE